MSCLVVVVYFDELRKEFKEYELVIRGKYYISFS